MSQIHKQTVFWLVAVGIHNLRGICPYGEHGGTLSLRRGSKTSKKPQKTTKKVKKSKKHVRINNQGPFFGWFHGQGIDSGVRVHMGTLGLVWGSVGGQKWPKMSPRSITIWEIEKNEPNSQTKSVFWLAAVGIHKLGGISPYGDPGVLWASGGGQKPQKKPQKNDQKSKKIEKTYQSIMKVRFLADSTVKG